ncbi:MAG: glycosyltransferase family 2 protein [Casimicrobiaceae bacterium]|nr:glycosyltransferase family 2 protein [Casimicrobiaceae bacterium]
MLAVVVCYYPNVAAVRTLATDVLATGVADVVLVDNTEVAEVSMRLQREVADLGIEVVCQHVNLGVAEAQNIALRHALQRGYRAALLLDQDSKLERGTLAQLLGALESLRAQGHKVAAVGPAFVDAHCKTVFPFVYLRRFRMHPIEASDATAVPCDLLISSGTLVALDAVESVGLLKSEYFIDYVDIEWCARARARGWQLFGVPQAKMRHSIGDGSLSVLGRTIPIHAPQRQYYQIRNALLLAREAYLPLKWRVHLLYRALAQLALFCTLCPPRITRARWMLRGLWDGVLGKHGRIGKGRTRLRRLTSPSPTMRSAALDSASTATHTRDSGTPP